ncbi:MAG: hypothetical protein ABFD64_07510 [Armatimonadota bacterium]
MKEELRKALPANTQNDIRTIRALVKRIEGGQTSALPELRQAIDCTPAIMEDYGNLAKITERSLIRTIYGGDILAEEATRKKLKAMREGIIGDDASPLVRLLVERVAICWLQVHHLDTVYAQQMVNLSNRQQEFYQRSQERAHRRYMSAIRTLAQVKRLELPTLQINLSADKQINLIDGQHIS